MSRPTAGHMELVFSHVTADDAGNYTCTSRNSVGVDEKIALLTVQCTYALRFSYVQCRGYAFSALTLSVGCQEEHPACKVE